MKILYDITQLFDHIGRINGTKRHIFEIAKNMIISEPQNEYLFGVRPSRWKFLNQKDDLIEKILQLNPKIVKMLEFSHYMWLNEKVDIYHANKKVYKPFPANPKIVLTIHGLNPILFPENERKKQKNLNSTKKSIDIADVVITVSNHVKKQICEIFDVDEKKVKVVYNGCGEEIAKKSFEEVNEVLNKFGIKSQYILFLISSRNDKHIVNFAEKLAEKISSLNLNLDIIVVGDRFKNKNKIKFLGYVSNEELSALYSGAFCHILPDIKEGFGLTVLEALKCGCPVITSPNSPMEEVAKDSALYAKTPDEAATLIKNLLENNNLREKLIKKGMKRALEFTWEKSAKEVINIYKELVSKKQ
jgi:glycosyltransferase involved in cell wall biosynthesis